MPQLAPITVQNGAGDNVVFKPHGMPGGLAILKAPSETPSSADTMSVSSTLTPAKRRNVKIKLALPVAQDVTVGGVTRRTVIRNAYAEVSFSFAEDSLLPERREARDLIKNALVDATIMAVVDDLDYLY